MGSSAGRLLYARKMVADQTHTLDLDIPESVLADLRSLTGHLDIQGSGVELDVIAPFQDALLASVPSASPEDVKRAVATARTAQVEWALRSVRERAEVLSRFHDLLLDNADRVMDVIQAEAGKARVPAFEEVFDTVAVTRYYLNVGPSLLKRRRRAVSLPGFTTAFEYRHPVGVVANICPWNFPFTLAISDIVPALLAGNAVVLKPDEKTPFSALLGVALLREAGLPRDLAQVLPGPGEEIGPQLIDSVDYVTFTGSTEVGRRVAERAGARLIGASMELGGKNAAIVLSDADFDTTVPGVSRAVFANGGQLCIAAERIYVHSSVYDRFVSAFGEHTKQLVMTRRFDYSSDLSSMIDRAHVENVHEHVKDAVASGATLVTGGSPRPEVGPLFYEPTVLTDVDESMMLCRVETFGPVVSIYPFDEVEEAVSMANDSEYGLNFSVWTSDTSRGVELASRLQAGTVGVNDGYAATWSSYDAPMGGMKSSGLGRRHGREGILKFTEAQTVAVQRLVPAFAPPFGLSYERYQRLLTPLLRILKRLPFYK